jgi:hypothetical protein
VTPPLATPVLALGASWLYLDDGSDLGAAGGATGWATAAFDDAAWKVGTAPIGAGFAGFEATTLTAFLSRRVTYYFRKRVSVSSTQLSALDVLGARVGIMCDGAWSASGMRCAGVVRVAR